MNTKVRNLLFIGVFVLCMALVLLLLVVTQPKAPEEEVAVDTTITLHSGTKDDVKSLVIKNEHSEFKIKSDTVQFPNGSLIKIINQGSTAKAYRVHKILLSDMSDLELINVLNPMVRDYEEEQRWRKETSF